MPSPIIQTAILKLNPWYDGLRSIMPSEAPIIFDYDRARAQSGARQFCFSFMLGGVLGIGLNLGFIRILAGNIDRLTWILFSASFILSLPTLIIFLVVRRWKRMGLKIAFLIALLESIGGFWMLLAVFIHFYQD